MVKFPDGTARVLVEGLWRIRIKEYHAAHAVSARGYELLRDETEDSVELQAMLRNAHKQFEEIAKMSTALLGPGQNRRAEHRTPRPFRRPHRRESEPQPRRPPETARNHFRPRASPKTAAHAQPRAGGAHAQFQNPERRRLVHRQDAARLFPARTDARHPARTGRRRTRQRRNQIVARKNRADADARRGPQGRLAGTGTPAADAARRRRIRASRAITSTGF